MEELIQTIPKNSVLESSQDYEFLRTLGIEHIQKLGSKIWTDYNAHDPGITMLELLSYAITDLGYRTGFEVKDIIAPENGDPSVFEECFHKAAKIFPCNQVTITDLRKILIDIDGIRNAWIRESAKFETDYYVNFNDSILTNTFPTPDIISLKVEKLKGLYDVVIEFDRNLIKKGETIKEDEVWKTAKKQVHKYRNLCEDFFTESLIVKKPDGCEEIKLFVDIDVQPNSNNESIFAEVLHRMEQFFSPTVTFYAMQELFDKGLRSDQIFEGPLLQHGFVDDDELKAIQKVDEIHTSDLYNIIMDIEGVIAVRNLGLINFVNTGCTPGGGVVPEIANPEKWCLKLYNYENPNPLDLDLILKADSVADISEIRFYKGDKDIPITINTTQVFNKLEVLRLSDKKRRNRLENEVFDLEIPLGDFRELEDYYPIQNELPLTYGTGEEGLSANVSEERKAQAKQLKAYLMFFEQLLANYFSQLVHVRELFSWNDQTDKTYFSQVVQGVKDMQNLYVPSYVDAEGNTINLVIADVLQQATLKDVIQKDAESPEVFFDRRNRFLNHLIARFNELFTEYSLVMMGIGKGDDLITDKAHFLADYDTISHDRGKGFDIKKIQVVEDSDLDDDFKGDVWDTENIAGYQFRVSRFLGIENIKRRFLYSGHNFSMESIMTGPSTEEFYFRMLVDFGDVEIVLTGDLQLTDDLAFTAFNDMLAGWSLLEYADIGAGPYQFEIWNAGSTIRYATSQEFDVPSERNVARDFISDEYFDASNPNLEASTGYLNNVEDGLHVIEHILLRPKNANYDFLPVSTEPTDSFLTTQFENVVIEQNSLDSSYGTLPAGSIGISLYEIPLTGGPIHLYNIVSFNPLDDFELLKIFGASFGNYTLKSDGGLPAAFYFYVSDTSGNQLGQSKKFVTESERNNALLKMLAFFALAKNGSLGTCSSTVDPYSYRATVVLPSWTERALDFNYRKLAEKIIRLEAPAHVSLDIFWIDHNQMRELEICYRKFLLETAKGDPNEDELPADLLELVDQANCTMEEISNLVDAFSAIYDVKPFFNEDYFRDDSVTNKIGHVFADVVDPSALPIVKAEIVGGDPLPNFIGIQGDLGLNSVGAKYDTPGSFDVGDIVLVSSYPGTQADQFANPLWVDDIIPATWTILIETTNILDNVSCNEITITIIKDSEAVWTIEPAKHQNCYETNDLLASAFDNNNLPSGDIVNAVLVSVITFPPLTGTTSFVLPPGIGLNESAGFIPSYDDGTNGDSLVGDLIITDPALVQASVNTAGGIVTYKLKIKTEDITGGITEAEVVIQILFDLSLTVDTTLNCLHIDQYTTGSNIVTITDTDGIDTITVLTPTLLNPSLAFLNSIGIDLVAEPLPLGPHGDPIYYYFQVTNHATLKTYIDNLANPHTFPVILEITDGCGYVENIQVDLCIEPDTEAVAEVIPIQHINSFNTGDTVITITDFDDGIVSVVATGGASVIDDAGLEIVIVSAIAYIKVKDETIFEDAALVDSLFTPTTINSQDAFTYTFDVVTTDLKGGISNLTLTIEMYKDREAIYVFAYPSGTSILAYLNFPANENNNNNSQKMAPFSEVKVKSADFLPVDELAPIPSFSAPVLFDSSNPIVANVNDPDGPIVAAVELIDAFSVAPGGSFYKLGSGTDMVSYPVMPVYTIPLSHWGAMLNPITGTISIGLNSKLMTDAFNVYGVGTHYHRIKTTDIFGGTTIHDLEIVIEKDLPAIYVASGTYPKSFDKYNPGDIIKFPEDPNGPIIKATIKSGTIPPGTEFDSQTGAVKVLPAFVAVEEVPALPITFTVGETAGTVSIGKTAEPEVLAKKSEPASTTESASEALTQPKLVAGTWNFTVTTTDEFGGVTENIPVTITILPKAIGGTKTIVKKGGDFLGSMPEKYPSVLPKKTSSSGGSSGSSL